MHPVVLEINNSQQHLTETTYYFYEVVFFTVVNPPSFISLKVFKPVRPNLVRPEKMFSPEPEPALGDPA